MKDPSRWLINGIMLIILSVPSLFFIVPAIFSENDRHSAYKNGVRITLATLDSAWQGQKCTRGSCVDRYYVKYSFTANGFPGVNFFSVGQNFADQKTRYLREQDEVSVHIPVHEWIVAQQTRKIGVSYSPSNPWANDPYGHRNQNNQAGHWIMLSILFFGLFSFGVFSLYKYRTSKLQV